MTAMRNYNNMNGNL